MDAVHLLLLRTRLANADENLTDSFVGKMKGFRVMYEEVLMAKRKSQEFGLRSYCDSQLEVFVHLWKALSTLPMDDPFYLPPIYKDESNQKIFVQFIEQLYIRTSSPAVCQTGNFILGGIEGTGKTTIAKALCLAAGILTSDVLILYYDLKQTKRFPRVSMLLHEASHRLEIGSFTLGFGTGTLPLPPIEIGMADVIQKLKISSRSTCLGLIFDEIQIIADLRCIEKEEMLEFFFEFQDFARTFGGLIVATGSSADIHSMFFKSLRLPCHQKYLHLPDFNKQLCNLYYISALRSTDSLQRYVQERYSLPADEELLSALLFRTGGIGRFVHEAIQHQSTDHPLSTVVLENAKSAMKALPTGFALFAIFIYLANRPLVDALLRWNEKPVLFDRSFGISEPAMRERFREWNLSDYEQKLTACIEAGLLYERRDGDSKFVEFAIPQVVLHIFKRELEPEDTLHLLCTVLMIYFDLSNNGGAPMERYLQKRLYRLLPSLFQSRVLLRVSFDRNYLLSVTSLSQLLNKTLIWKGETGIDGFEIIPPRGSGDHTINLWQNKGGMMSKTIGGGDPETYRRHFKTDKTVANIKDDMLAGILVKAELGMISLLLALHRTFPKKTFRLGVLLVTTTMIATNGEQMLSNIDGKVMIPADLLSAFGRAKKIQMPKDIKNLQYQVKLFHGTTWFGQIVDDSHLEFLASDDRPKSETIAVPAEVSGTTLLPPPPPLPATATATSSTPPLHNLTTLMGKISLSNEKGSSLPTTKVQKEEETETSPHLEEAYKLLLEPGNAKNAEELRRYLDEELGLTSWQDLDLVRDEVGETIAKHLKLVPGKKFLQLIRGGK